MEEGRGCVKTGNPRRKEGRHQTRGNKSPKERLNEKYKKIYIYDKKRQKKLTVFDKFRRKIKQTIAR